MQHLSGYLLQLKFDPPLLFNTHFQYGNRISLEFSQLYHWHPLMPDSFLINGNELLYEQFLFNTSVLTHYGIEKMVDAFSRQPAGQVETTDVAINMESGTNCKISILKVFFILVIYDNSSIFVLQIGGGHNINAVLTKVAAGAIKESRQLRMQPFNEYRKRFNLKPYTSFREFNGKKNCCSSV